MPATPVVIVNTGTPASCASGDVRAFLKRFLSDRTVIDLPDWFWKPVLYLHVLPLRAPMAASRYRKIWTKEGSPQKVFMESIARKMVERLPEGRTVRCAFRYAEPDIAQVVDDLAAQGHESVDFLPLYPQYAMQTVGSVGQMIAHACEARGLIFRVIGPYGTHPAYVELVAQQIASRRRHRHLVTAFHGLPVASVNPGNPYDKACEALFEAVAGALGLSSGEATLAYQSRFGHGKWLSPYLEDVLRRLPSQGVTEVDVAALSFSCDCLETLEEIALHARDVFVSAGGKDLHYIPCLNDDESVCAFYASLAS